eukprot:COSAG02_NODE_42064_length_388_cov_0.875433_1_plen_47_part_01
MLLHARTPDRQVVASLDVTDPTSVHVAHILAQLATAYPHTFAHGTAR